MARAGERVCSCVLDLCFLWHVLQACCHQTVTLHVSVKTIDAFLHATVAGCHCVGDIIGSMLISLSRPTPDVTRPHHQKDQRF